MDTLMRKGIQWDIYWNEETKRWVLKSDVWEHTYSFGTKKKMIDMWRQLERVKSGGV